MYNIFLQRIGIWYKDAEWRDKMFEQIAKIIPEESIFRIIKNNNEKSIRLKDGSTIKFVSANDCSRGNAFSKSYIQEGISFEVYRTIVSPCTKPIFSESIVVDKFEDFGYWRTANKYYWEDKLMR